jgi:hypothetical protein
LHILFLLATFLRLHFHVLFNSIGPFPRFLQALFRYHHLTNIDMHGFLTLYQTVSLLHHVLFKCLNINNLLCIEYKLTYLIFFMCTVGGILFLREIEETFLEERLIALG